MESVVSDDKIELYSLPIRDGALGIPILQERASIHYDSSKAITGCCNYDEARTCTI